MSEDSKITKFQDYIQKEMKKKEKTPPHMGESKHKKHREDAMMELQVAMGVPQRSPRKSDAGDNETTINDVPEDREGMPPFKKPNEAGTLEHKE